jgi:RNA polymerase sigma-70 factor (ECF subfamily)
MSDGTRPASPLSDDDLMAMFASGDRDAFDVIFDRHHVMVYNYARHLVRREAEAEEVMQDAFLAVARAAGVYAPRGRFRSWLISVTRNLCFNRINAERARRETQSGSAILVLPATNRSACPDDRAVAAESEDIVRRALDTLPERQREVLVLYSVEGMPYRDIAEALEMPIGTVKTLLHRARAAIARAIAVARGEEDRHAM